MSRHHYDKQYENDDRCYPRELVGVHPLGGGGIVEYHYRHYFELKHIKQIVRFTKDMNVLELGSGNGRWAASLSVLVKHYTAVDSNPEGTAIAREEIDRLGIGNVDVKEMDVADFRGDRPYDMIYFSGVCEFLEDHQIHQVVANIWQWLTPRALVLDRSTLNHKEASIHRENGGYYVYRTPLQIDEIFGTYGFSLECRTRSYRPLRGGRFASGGILEPFWVTLVRAARPVSFYLMLSLSCLIDIIRPTQMASSSVSHDFSLFSRKGCFM